MKGILHRFLTRTPAPAQPALDVLIARRAVRVREASLVMAELRGVVMEILKMGAK